MEITVSHQQGRVPVTVIHLAGEITAASYERLQAQAQEVFQAGARNVVLDLAAVPHISSAGLRAIHYLHNLLRSVDPAESDEAISRGLRDGTYKSPHLKLLSPTPRVLETIRMAGFDMYLEIYHDLGEAVSSF